MRFRAWRRRALLVLALALAAGCAGERAPHPGVGDLWRSYRKLAPKRAMAVAGQVDGIWVGAVAGGARLQDDANAAALGECRRKRRQRRIQDPCLLYAIGSEVVWPTN